MWILGSFGDPREFSHHSKAVLSNLIEPVFHLQPLLLKAVWFGVLKTNALYQFSLHLQMLTLVNADHRALHEKRIPCLKNIHFHPWSVAPSLCLFPWPCVQCRLQMWDCNHCRIIPHLPWCKVTGLQDFKWFRNYSIWVLSPIITQMGASSLRAFITPNFAWGNHLLSDGCLWSCARDQLHISHGIAAWGENSSKPLRTSAPHRQNSAGYSHCADPNKHSHLYWQIIKENWGALWKTVICFGVKAKTRTSNWQCRKYQSLSTAKNGWNNADFLTLSHILGLL